MGVEVLAPPLLGSEVQSFPLNNGEMKADWLINVYELTTRGCKSTQTSILPTFFIYQKKVGVEHLGFCFCSL